MDPDAALSDLRSYCRDIQHLFDSDEGVVQNDTGLILETASGLATTFQALDVWLCKLGFLPKDWTAAPPQPE